MKPFHSEPLIDLFHGDVLAVLGELPAGSVQSVISSPPYWGLRDYGLPPGVWGGDAACDHVWGGEAIRREESGWHRHPDYPRDGGGPIGAGKKPSGQPSQGSLCRCGAWRGCHGLEPTPELWVENELTIFRALRRVLRDDGTIFWNIGDSYATGSGSARQPGGAMFGKANPSVEAGAFPMSQPNRMPQKGLKPGNLMGMPYRLMLALQADGWIVRSIITWAKGSSFEDRSGSVMPESVSGWRWERCRVKVKAQGADMSMKHRSEGRRNPVESLNPDLQAKYNDCPSCLKCAPNDGLVLRKGSWRPTSAFEVILQIAKTADYFCDGEAVREDGCPSTFEFNPRYRRLQKTGGYQASFKADPAGMAKTMEGRVEYMTGHRNLRNVWRINTEPNSMSFCYVCGKTWMKGGPAKCCEKKTGGHFAAFPTDLVEPIVKASTPEKGSCGKCGAPWARVVERETALRPDNRRAVFPNSRPGVEGVKDFCRATPDACATSTTLSHRPTCGCGVESVPAIVLDPFSGSGTTALVARSLGRRAWGIELSEDYLKLSMQRLGDQPEPAKASGGKEATQEGLF